MKRFVNRYARAGARLCAVAVCAAALLAGCRKDGAAAVQSATVAEAPVASADGTAEQGIPAEAAEDQIPQEEPNYELPSVGFSTTAHAAHLNDAMVFTPVPTQGITDGRTAVVGSNVARLFPESAFGGVTEEGRLPGINATGGEEAVPIGTLVQILGVQGANERSDGPVYRFENCNNYFYKVQFGGKEGYIFGADLYGLDNTAGQNQIAAERYRTNGRSDVFYPVAGFTPLSAPVKESLEQNRLALQKTAPQQNPYPDDMISLYATLRRLDLPIFITTDIAAHAQHLVFDRMLQYTEEFYFEPRLAALTDAFIAALSANADGSAVHRERAVQYFQVAQALLRAAPERMESDDWQRATQYKARDTAAIFAEYPEAVQKDIAMIMAASGSKDAIFGNPEDFSQYKPRGHYTKNGVLESYFRAEMWFGRLHFLIASSDFDDKTNKLTEIMEPVALFITDTVRKNPALYDDWKALFDPITDLIGLCDDLSFADVLPLWKAQNVSDFASWAAKPENLQNFMQLCHDTLRPPAIQGNSVWSGPAVGTYWERKPPMGWRFLGQRFTWDSYIHDQVTPPRLVGILDGYEDTLAIPSGLHVTRAFGSHTADEILAETQYGWVTGLKARMYKLQDEFCSPGDDFWNATYYQQVLRQIQTQATFEPGAGFYFTESPLWGVKSQIAALGTWAELRHDTILYVKQSYAERGGGDGDWLSFRIEPLPVPVHYIEPNVYFWQSSLAAVDGLLSVYRTYNLLDSESESTLTLLRSSFAKALDIAKKEAADTPITADENNWIPTFISALSQAVMVHSRGDYIEDYDQFKMACIADVFTNAELGMILETAVGTPLRLYVPLNDAQGGKRIAVGYGFTYHEFEHAQSDRMTDEQWKAIVYKPNADLGAYTPEWEAKWLLNADNSF